jgi:predicted ArsR family transcriptional regulator
MSHLPETSDVTVLDLLRVRGGMRVRELSVAMGVTATAVRQRLTRLMAQGLIQRSTMPSSRGRPSHSYELTDEGRRQTGSNFSDLAVALWEEIRSIADPAVRRGLLQKLSTRLAEQYADQIEGNSTAEKMHSLVKMLAQRDVVFEVEVQDGRRPVLKAVGCPYTELAEKDRSVCSMERMLFAELLDEKLHLGDCRLDGANCCTFELSSSEVLSHELLLPE